MAVINGTSGNDVITGTTAADIIYGYAGNDTIDGGDGNDVIDAGSGVDIVSGGAGHDIFKISTVSSGMTHSTYDGGTGLDTLDYSSSASYMFWSFDSSTGLYNVRDVDFRRVEKLIGGSGQDIFNFYTISDGLTIYGGGGADRIYGGYGDDIIYGGDGNDDLSAGGGVNLIYGDAGDDYVSATSGSGTLDGGSGSDTIEAYTRIDLSLGKAYSFSAAYDIANFENIVVGSAAAQAFGIGDDNANRISVYSIFETYTSAIFEGRGGNDHLQGGALADQLDGGTGDDELYGRKGNDSLIGGDGNDLLDGGEGDDLLDGGTGTDTISYAELNLYGVTVNLSAGTAQSSESGSDTLKSIENVIGSDMDDDISGNSLANRLEGRSGNDTLSGGSGADILDGGSGADRMIGGTGDDIYYVDDSADIVVEYASGGARDQIYASVSYSLSGTYVETLTLTGSGNIDGTGNNQAQSIYGNAGNNILSGMGGSDRLNGGLGADTLIGGSGSDQFVFDSRLGAGNVDRISDFAIGTDDILIDNAVFTGLATGALTASAFHIGSQAGDASDRIIYDNQTGALWFDADGSGGIAAVQFATLTPQLALSAADFLVV
ncbi:calcium-binding protein [Sphingobium yanoikuyae]|uniref:calcium-binding protein n=1 Tax=Sphingobium yanoikuyae TaxID=13690 RepID=UPI0026EBD6DE|nr:calcium-binding protein [Sphingobium yanoikuyae]